MLESSLRSCMTFYLVFLQPRMLGSLPRPHLELPGGDRLRRGPPLHQWRPPPHEIFDICLHQGPLGTPEQPVPQATQVLANLSKSTKATYLVIPHEADSREIDAADDDDSRGFPGRERANTRIRSLEIVKHDCFVEEHGSALSSDARRVTDLLCCLSFSRIARSSTRRAPLSQAYRMAAQPSTAPSWNTLLDFSVHGTSRVPGAGALGAPGS